MRTEQFELSDETLELFFGMPKRYRPVDPSQFYITDNGLEALTPPVRSTPSRISTFTSKIESWCLNLSSRAAKGLNISYWSFTALSCITFFTSHWSLFLAFLIPALIMNHMRIARETYLLASSSHSGASMNGT